MTLNASAVRLERGDALSASITPSDGFGCTSFMLGDWEVLGPQGMRLVFPWVVSGSTIPNAAWQVHAAREDANEASVQARYRTNAAAHAYPYDVDVEATWRLDPQGLQLDLLVANRSRVHAPFGLAVRVDLSPLGEWVDALAPAEEVWPRAAAGLVVGEPQPVTGRFDLRRPRHLAEALDALYTRRHFANLRTQAAVLDPASGREVWLTTSADFRELRLSLDTRGAGQLESATCLANAATLHASQRASGLRRLAPGESWRGSAVLVARSPVRPSNQRIDAPSLCC